MRIFLIMLLLVIGASCKTNHYLSAPIKNIPNIVLQNNLKSNGILIASGSSLKVDTASFENCLKGLRLNVETKSEIKIIDEVFFIKPPNTNIMNELKAKYNVDGLLLLTKLNVQKKGFDVPSGNYKYIDNRMPEPHFQRTKINILWTNVDVKITSHWEYHDFETGKSYLFSVKNDKILELGQYVSDIDYFIEDNFDLLDSLFYLNGSITASNIIGLNN